MKQISLLVAIAILLPVDTFVPDAAIAAPKGCLDSQTLRAATSGVGGNFMLFDPSDRSANKDGPVNIREQPNTRSRVRYVAASRNPADILQQVAGGDGYCWLKVRVITSQSTAQSVVRVTGWVWGDLIRTALD